ncbi:hypothetical protein CesoFtcFv8_007892 [Champsocephalus esox]|uniref:Uncharacterized protein n=1 Tax=Champsocephalus esox TaxID=159716 RepID=A0AAN8CEH3_9TELE|nr:hypothetical protein CesoFtcFv8_007892 [Champsocephalus esox]
MLSTKKKRPGGTRGDRDTRRPHRHATRLASLCYHYPPFRSSPPTNTSHYFTPSTVPLGSTCHPSINPIPS